MSRVSWIQINVLLAVLQLCKESSVESMEVNKTISGKSSLFPRRVKTNGAVTTAHWVRKGFRGERPSAAEKRSIEGKTSYSTTASDLKTVWGTDKLYVIVFFKFNFPFDCTLMDNRWDGSQVKPIFSSLKLHFILRCQFTSVVDVVSDCLCCGFLTLSH